MKRYDVLDSPIRSILLLLMAAGAMLLSAGCSTPPKGDGVLEGRVDWRGGRMEGPLGTFLVVPEDAVSETCTVTMIFGKQPPGKTLWSDPISITVWIDLYPCAGFDAAHPATLVLSPYEECSGCLAAYTDDPHREWYVQNVENNDAGQVYFPITEPGFYTIIAK